LVEIGTQRKEIEGLVKIMTKCGIDEIWRKMIKIAQMKMRDIGREEVNRLIEISPKMKMCDARRKFVRLIEFISKSEMSNFGW